MSEPLSNKDVRKDVDAMLIWLKERNFVEGGHTHWMIQKPDHRQGEDI